jgi:hypothetical protein
MLRDKLRARDLEEHEDTQVYQHHKTVTTV